MYTSSFCSFPPFLFSWGLGSHRVHLLVVGFEGPWPLGEFNMAFTWLTLLVVLVLLLMLRGAFKEAANALRRADSAAGGLRLCCCCCCCCRLFCSSLRCRCCRCCCSRISPSLLYEPQQRWRDGVKREISNRLLPFSSAAAAANKRLHHR